MQGPPQRGTGYRYLWGSFRGDAQPGPSTRAGRGEQKEEEEEELLPHTKLLLKAEGSGAGRVAA